MHAQLDHLGLVAHPHVDDSAFGRELDRVGDQVVEHLLQMVRVSGKGCSLSIAHIDFDLVVNRGQL